MKRLSIQYNNQFAFTGVVDGNPVDLEFCAYFYLRIEQEVETDAGWITLYPRFKIDGKGEVADKIMALHDGDVVDASGANKVCNYKGRGYRYGYQADHVELLAKKGEKWNL